MPMDYKDLGIVERSPSHSNEMMLDRVRIMNTVMNQTVPRKERHGNKYIIKQVPKYPRQEELMEKIKNSVDYYEQ